MKLKQLLTDDDAVSPVIGVILMVAITVILAAVIGTFVLGLGDRVSEAQPNANFNFEYTDTDDQYAEITHDGGDGVESSQLIISIGGDTVWEPGDTVTENNWNGNKITAGDNINVSSGDFTEGDGSIDDGETVKVIWTASGSDKTAVIGESEVSL
jgi:flagellin-like protein